MTQRKCTICLFFYYKKEGKNENCQSTQLDDEQNARNIMPTKLNTTSINPTQPTSSDTGN